MENVLEIRGLKKHYGAVHALNGLTLNIPKGAVYGLLGPNGSGKSTTLGMLLGTILPTSGSFQWKLNDSDHLKPHQIRRKVGSILEQPNFIPHLTALQNLKVVAKIKALSNPNILEVLDRVGLNDRANHKFSTYSYGMKQRLALASAILSNPEVLVLDEPTNGLDPVGIADMRRMIEELAHEGRTVILASHLLDEVERLCDHVAVLRKGVLLANGTVAEIMSSTQQYLLRAPNIEELTGWLQEQDWIDHLLVKPTGVLIETGIDGATLNRTAVEAGIFLSHLESKQETLEETFLKLVK